MCGPSGSGKSYLARGIKAQDPKNVGYVSRDEIRFSYLRDGDDYFKYETKVFKDFCKEVQRGLLHNRVTIADATFLNPKSRLKLLNRLKGLKEVDVMILYKEASLDECLMNNRKRQGRAFVPEGVIRRQFLQFEKPTEKEYPYAAIFNTI